MSLATVILPSLARVEENFHFRRSQEWMDSWWIFSFPIGALYLVSIFSVKSLMKSRKPYNLRRMLTMWNVGLAVFSFIGAMACLPGLIGNLLSYGLEYGNCNIDGITRQPLRLWMFLFIISKVLELGDTLFIVLRKSQLNFLHWYHHVTVLVYCWYAYPILHEIGNWFGGLNYLIHTIMYSYYAFRSMGLRLPPSIAKLITVLQILQMFVGTFLNIMSLRKSEMFDCEVQHRLAYFGLGIYTTYMILFLNYFFQRYVRKTK